MHGSGYEDAMAQSRVDRTPGRRRAEPTPPARRRATPARPGRAHKRADRAATTRRTGQYLETPEALPPPELTPVRRWSVPVVVGGWLPLAVAGTAAVVTARTALPVPSWLPTSGAV